MANTYKTIAIMQPYFLPYFGYFQLINAVDTFVLYNDVQFIKQGWINRNRIIINNNAQFITVPLLKVSSNKKINETEINHAQFSFWLSKLSKTLQQSYKKAINLDMGIDLLNTINNSVKEFSTIDQLNKFVIKQICQYLDISTMIEDSSILFNNSSLKGQDRILDICKELSSERYINAIGGKELYSKEAFLSKGIELGFINSELEPESFSYSILHAIMLEDKDQLKRKLNSYHVS